MDLSLLTDDVAARPALLRALARRLRDGSPWAGVVPRGTRRVRLVGMGSSAYAAGAAAGRARAGGADMVADLASLRVGWAPGPGTLVVAVSATGGSVETLAAARAAAGPHLAAVTADTAGELATAAGAGVVPLAATDLSGVSSLSYSATLVLLMALADEMTGRPLTALADGVDRAADAADSLLAAHADWVPRVSGELDGPDGLPVLAPAERFASAQQSALMVREVPRRPAVACETGDWSHVDVYLAKTLEYRALLLGGSPWETQAMEWVARRGAVVVPVGAVDPTARAAGGAGVREPLRYPGDDDPVVAMLAETTVAELVAAAWWSVAGEGPPLRTASTRRFSARTQPC